MFKELVPFNNQEVVAKIHTTFILQYIKDVVLARYFLAESYTNFSEYWMILLLAPFLQ